MFVIASTQIPKQPNRGLTGLFAQEGRLWRRSSACLHFSWVSWICGRSLERVIIGSQSWLLHRWFYLFCMVETGFNSWARMLWEADQPQRVDVVQCRSLKQWALGCASVIRPLCLLHVSLRTTDWFCDLGGFTWLQDRVKVSAISARLESHRAYEFSVPSLQPGVICQDPNGPLCRPVITVRQS